MSSSPLRLIPGTVIVLEGLDATGKSTQAARLRHTLSRATFTHMPTGNTSFSNGVAQLLASDARRPTTVLGAQLAHLASHADTVPGLVSAAAHGGLVLDRWWWSTVAYGWFGGGLADTGMTERAFREVVDAVWHPIRASVVFLFLHPHEQDRNNTPTISDGYRTLVDEVPELVVHVPAASEAETAAIITRELLDRGLTQEARNDS